MPVINCPYCPKICDTAAMLGRHMQEHGRLPICFTDCPFCTEHFDTLAYLKKHIHTHHPPSLTPADEQLSSNAEDSQTILREASHTLDNSKRDHAGHIPNNDEHHDAAHTTDDNDRHEVAAQSSNTYPNKRQKHPATFQCNLCPKRYTRAFTLRAHLRYHVEQRPFVCTVCGKAFTRNHDRKTHEKLHDGSKDYVCKGRFVDGETWGCGRRFARLTNLARHFRSARGKICIASLPNEGMAVDIVRRNRQIKPATALTDRDSPPPIPVHVRTPSPDPQPPPRRPARLEIPVAPTNPPDRYRDEHTYRNVPRLDRTMTDVYGDELYSPNFTINATPPTHRGPPTTKIHDIFNRRLDTANHQHLSKQLSTRKQLRACTDPWSSPSDSRTPVTLSR